MKNKKPLIAIIILACIIAASFALPQAEYVGTGYISKLKVPDSFSGWTGRDVRKEVGLGTVATSALYNFVSGAFASQYIKSDNDPLLFIILDAGNFHHPKVCFTGAGFDIKELPDTEFNLPGRTLKAHTLYTTKGNSRNLSLYWIVIDKNIAHEWIEQKFKQLFFSLFGKKRVGLMVRVDIPLTDNNINEAILLAKEFVNDLSRKLQPEDADYILGGN